MRATCAPSHVARGRSTRAKAASAPSTNLSRVEEWTGGKRLQTQVAEVVPGVTTIRSLDWDRDRFDIEFGLQNGTTYNSYVVRGPEKVALVDVSHEKFRELYFEALEGLLDPKDIDYVVVNHTEPDHSGLVKDLVEMNPDITVVGSKVAIMFLKELINKPFNNTVVKGGDELDLGGEHKLEFVMAPNLHWPDTILTFDHKNNLLYTCDVFGMHYCSDKVYDEELSELLPHYRFYYDCLMGPNAKSVLTALKRIRDLPYTTICNGHGPLLRYNVADMVDRYQKWSESIGKAGASIAVLYASDYGYSDRLSQILAKGIAKTGVAVEMVDLNTVDAQELAEIIPRSTGVAILAPPQSGPAHDMFGVVLSSVKSKQTFLIAESYGGDDEPVDSLFRSMVDLGLKPATEALRVKDTPDEGLYQLFEEVGTDMGQTITKKDSVQKMKSSMSPEVAKALGRISSGLYVVTAGHENVRSAMIASWVSQASFEPLGISIAVAKDRAIESFMQVGDSFVLNCLEEGKFAPIMKHFLKRFPAGADRFEGVNWVPASNGQTPILTDAVAFMECKVVSRMEVPDHWIVYAEVFDGSVSKPESRTAAHHRKVASYY